MLPLVGSTNLELKRFWIDDVCHRCGGKFTKDNPEKRTKRHTYCPPYHYYSYKCNKKRHSKEKDIEAVDFKKYFKP